MSADAAAAEVRAALEHAGARFMAMFDDAVEGAERANGSTTARRASSRASPSPRPRGAAPTSARDDRRGVTSPARAARKRAREADGASAASPLPRARGPAAAAAADADANANANANANAPASAQPPAAVPVVVFGSDRPNADASRVGAESRGAEPRGAGDVPVARAKRLFMSERISRVHEDPAAPAPTTRPGRSDRDDRASPPNAIVPGLTGASLNDMRGKVAALGARGLDKWSRRALEARRLRSLGAKPEKAPRTPANVGVGAWRANEAREEARRMEAFEAGGRLMKKRREDASGAAGARGGGGNGDRDRGLAWGQGNFKGGVLTLSRRDVESKPDRRVATSDAYLAGTRLSGADGGGGRRGGKGKGGGKGGRPQGGKKKHGGKGGKRR